MPPSYESVNYSLRPAKNIERKMFCEAFRRLIEFGKLESYRYVGFGSTFFADFSLFHKALGIGNSISIEKDTINEKRFEFNKPYDCIRLMFGKSSDILPTLNWDLKTIIWLDYDYALDESILTDIAFVSTHAPTGSMLIVTTDARPVEVNERITALKATFEGKKLPPDLSEKKLAKWGTADLYRQIITNEINEKINIRNGTRPPGTEFQYKQLFNFHYADGAMMLTVGGLIYDKSVEHLVAKCSFESFGFIRTGEESFCIEVPSLTLKEMRHLDKQLPCNQLNRVDSPSIPEKDIQRYAQLYRYFPAFVDADVT
jgi:hypothetical protein